ncbi:3-oxoacyl-ACP reductase [Amycolatopsis dendrobii]|uniref:3-oxoacyl-ACP reductase n=1 Tax=Amycolatopsis dendrobii TaxID=2760662 RepID=UPI0028AEC43D|nr:3-oxoacyl-ACP reductase [Amycolatopsis dendrobii]
MSHPSTALSGRTAIVTGAGAGLGRAEALALAAAGANVVVNDVSEAGDKVVAEIEAGGGQALAVPGDIGDWHYAEELVAAATEGFGSLDIVVNNAGITRDAMLFNLGEQDWDDVIRVHLKGHAALSRAAARHWRQVSKTAGEPAYGRLINTSSEAFLLGGAGQPNYAAAKAGIAALTLSCARGLSRYGVRANAICPRARTAMTDGIFAAGRSAGGLDILAPERVAAFVAYLGSPAAEAVNGQVFVVYGDMVALLAPPTVEHRFVSARGAFDPAELERAVTPYFAGRDPRKTFAASDIVGLDDTETS